MVDYSGTNWFNKVSHIAQVGGIETAVLDNGQSKGTRVARINTGSGLRFKVVIDRAMDIAEASFNASNLTWISALGVTSPTSPMGTGNKLRMVRYNLWIDARGRTGRGRVLAPGVYTIELPIFQPNL